MFAKDGMELKSTSFTHLPHIAGRTGLDWTAFLIGNDGIYSGDDPVARPSLYLLGWSNYLFSLPKTFSGLYPFRCPCFSERDQIREWVSEWHDMTRSPMIHHLLLAGVIQSGTSTTLQKCREVSESPPRDCVLQNSQHLSRGRLNFGVILLSLHNILIYSIHCPLALSSQSVNFSSGLEIGMLLLKQRTLLESI